MGSPARLARVVLAATDEVGRTENTSFRQHMKSYTRRLAIPSNGFFYRSKASFIASVRRIRAVRREVYPELFRNFTNSEGERNIGEKLVKKLLIILTLDSLWRRYGTW